MGISGDRARGRADIAVQTLLYLRLNKACFLRHNEWTARERIDRGLRGFVKHFFLFRFMLITSFIEEEGIHNLEFCMLQFSNQNCWYMSQNFWILKNLVPFSLHKHMNFSMGVCSNNKILSWMTFDNRTEGFQLLSRQNMAFSLVRYYINQYIFLTDLKPHNSLICPLLLQW